MLKSDELTILKLIGNKIRQIRIEKGFSQENLGYEAEIPKNQIGRIERGEINTTILTLLKISTALGIELNELIKYQ